MIRWSNSQLQFTSCFGVLVQTGMIGQINKGMPFWAAFAIALPPLLGFLFFQPGEVRDSLVQFVQVGAAVWYFSVTAVLVAFLFQMPKPWPDWWPLFLVGIGLGQFLASWFCSDFR